MQFLQSIPALPKELLLAIGGALALILIWIWTHTARRHHLMIRRSEATDEVAYQLGRVANALERLATAASAAAPREKQPEKQPSSDDRPPQRTQWLSMFGR